MLLPLLFLLLLLLLWLLISIQANMHTTTKIKTTKQNTNSPVLVGTKPNGKGEDRNTTTAQECTMNYSHSKLLATKISTWKYLQCWTVWWASRMEALLATDKLKLHHQQQPTKFTRPKWFSCALLTFQADDCRMIPKGLCLSTFLMWFSVASHICVTLCVCVCAFIVLFIQFSQSNVSFQLKVTSTNQYFQQRSRK